MQRPETFAVEAQKIRSYLLNVNHPVGGPKARFFIGWGFRVDDPAGLTFALVEHASPAHQASALPFCWGTKYVFEGRMGAPNGLTPWSGRFGPLDPAPTSLS